MRATVKARRRDEDRSSASGDCNDNGDDDGPTQLRQQSYVGPRPGAYWAAPGVASVRAPSPAPLPPPRQAHQAADLERAAATTTSADGDASPSYPRPPPPPARDPSVMLEAEPVLSILVNATPMPERPRRRLTRRTVFFLVAVFAVVAAAVAAGVIVGTTSSSRNSKVPATTGGGSEALSERPAPSPSPSSPLYPSSPPSPPPTATEKAVSSAGSGCLSESVAWSGCLQDSKLDIQACSDCYSPYFDLITNQTTCEELASLICAQLETCASSCGDCGTHIEAYETCHYGSDCFQSCPNDPTTPTATPAPSAVLECPDENEVLSDCVRSSGVGIDACNACLAGYGPETIETCDEAESYTCGAMDACSSECGDCEEDWVTWNNCLNAGVCDTVVCAASGPTTPSSPVTTPVAPAPSSPTFGTPAPSVEVECQSENDALSDCVRSSGVSIDACNECRAEFWPETIDSCAESESYTCGAMDACSECGNCEEELVIWTNCLNAGVCDTIVCPASAPNATAPSPTTTPVSRPLR